MREIKEAHFRGASGICKAPTGRRGFDGWMGRHLPICRRYAQSSRGRSSGRHPGRCFVNPPASSENPVSAMFCSQVLAETPESVPSIGRFCDSSLFVACQEFVCSFCCCHD